VFQSYCYQCNARGLQAAVNRILNGVEDSGSVSGIVLPKAFRRRSTAPKNGALRCLITHIYFHFLPPRRRTMVRVC
jgi:hypothetical protein